jgi:hypothetical protein
MVLARVVFSQQNNRAELQSKYPESGYCSMLSICASRGSFVTTVGLPLANVTTAQTKNTVDLMQSTLME